MGCLSDRATEGVLEVAKEADPDGVRTVGVLTKADLVTEQAVVQTLLQLVKGNTLKLGYYIVCNRGADDDALSISECQMKEAQEFAEPQWAELVKLGRTGVKALRAELQVLLTELARRELPKQRSEVEQRLSESRRKLESMGSPRDSSASQRECLVKLASQFERIVRDALDGRYEGNQIFSEKPELKLATEIIDLNEGFSEMMWRMGQRWRFDDEVTGDEGESLAYEAKAATILGSVFSTPELRPLVCTTTICPETSEESIMHHIEECYKESRGPELGTVCVPSLEVETLTDRMQFEGSLLAMMFRAQTSRWRSIVMAHVETVIVAVHRFIKALLGETFGDQRMREELWDLVLLEKLQTAYVRAKDQAEFLLDIEINGRPSTYNHYFSDNLQKARVERLEEAIKEAAITEWTDGDVRINLSAVPGLMTNKSNAEQVKKDIHDILKSYYKVSRKRFVDIVCRMAVEHFLLDGKGSPLKVLTPELIATMSDAQLDMIAGEDVTTKRERERLGSEIEGLKAAMAVLRG
jgi:hypothetical protein